MFSKCADSRSRDEEDEDTSLEPAPLERLDDVVVEEDLLSESIFILAVDGGLAAVARPPPPGPGDDGRDGGRVCPRCSRDRRPLRLVLQQPLFFLSLSPLASSLLGPLGAAELFLSLSRAQARAHALAHALA